MCSAELLRIFLFFTIDSHLCIYGKFCHRSHNGKGVLLLKMNFLRLLSWFFGRTVFSHLLNILSYFLSSTRSNSLLAIPFLEKNSWPWNRHPDTVELIQTQLTSAKFCLNPGSWPPGAHPRTRPLDDQSSGKCAQTTAINSLNPPLRNLCSRLLCSTGSAVISAFQAAC